MDNLSNLVEMSNRYGKCSDYVLAGGGNTSFKSKDTLYIKGSGVSLAQITDDGFVRMDRELLKVLYTKDYPEEEKTRESEVLKDLMAAKRAGEEHKRPSVETVLHDLFPHTYVLHVHPAFVNALTCCKDGEALVEKYFPNAVWIPTCNPGYVLSMICKKKLDAYLEKNGAAANILFLQNHGIFFAGNSVEEIDALVKKVESTIGAIYEKADITPFENINTEKAAEVAPVIRMLYRKFAESESAVASFLYPKALERYIGSKKAFGIFEYPPTPDHIVYCKARPLFLEACDDISEFAKNAEKAFVKFVKDNKFVPKMVAVEGLGIFACGKNIKEALTAKVLFEDELKVIIGSESVGGYLPMTKEQTDFIVNWEVESYRQKASLASDSSKRLSDKIALVTGSAQGFGKGIAESLAKEGAYVIIADMNEQGAQTVACELSTVYGDGKAISVGANVSDEDSVKAMFEKAALFYGGLDVYVNNAGIVRAGSLDEMTKSNFELVTAVNYTAYFLCTKYASKILKIQHIVDEDYMTDIIEINSKSGLAGSNKNFAYAGSKFGGIGLTQSFAMELAEYRIKVNAICPGNFLGGPLWSDPEKGLFVQYLRAGKVPGAKTIDDVRKFYESKVPLGRGCETEDVSKAILYIIDQKYETGQALPVTGGQEMLK